MRARRWALRNVMAELDLTMGLTGVGSIPALVPGLAHPHRPAPSGGSAVAPPTEASDMRQIVAHVTCAKWWRM